MMDSEDENNNTRSSLRRQEQSQYDPGTWIAPPNIRVGAVCHVQTAENRFGRHVLEDIKAFVLESPNTSIGMDTEDDDDEEEDDLDDDDSDEGDEMGPIGIEEVEMFEFVYGEEAYLFMGGQIGSGLSGQFGGELQQHGDISEPTGGQQQHAHPQQGFPRVARCRGNLTACSQRYNLYFAAYQDKIYVYQPKKSPQILPPPSIILQTKRSNMAKVVGGVLDRNMPHQMNHIMVGNLGNLEVLLLAFDDGDVGAFYTHAIARCILSNTEQCRNPGPLGPRISVPKQFFHENVGMSVWGLAIHEKSRLLAVSSNRHEVTVFAFSMSRSPAPLGERRSQDEPDDSPVLWCGQTALELEKHFQSRTRTWRIVLPVGKDGHNIPSIAFSDDEAGNADKIAAVDITGHTWLFDLWRIGSSPVQLPYPPSRMVGGARPIGWSVLVLADSSFRETKDTRETLGLRPDEIIQRSGRSKASNPLHTPDQNNWLDTTCSLFYTEQNAAKPEQFLSRYGAIYTTTHSGNQTAIPPPPTFTYPEHVEDDEGDSEMLDDSSEPESTHAYNGHGPSAALSLSDTRWANVCQGTEPAGHKITDLSDEIKLARAIIPSLGETPPLDGTLARLIDLTSASMIRKAKTKFVRPEDANFSNWMVKNMSILRTTSMDVELQPLDPTRDSIICNSVLHHHNHHSRRTQPFDLANHISERISIALHVPQLSLVVLGALHGRVALLSLNKATKRLDAGRISSIRPGLRAFRVEHVLPREQEEKRRMRPWCTLHGVAVSPVPDHRAKGLELLRRNRKGPPAVYRLVLHYMDHTILMYDLAKFEDDEELVIF